MKLKKLKLENFRLFTDLELKMPDSNLIVLVGNNGAGKTSLLDAIALCFGHFTGCLLSKSESYNTVPWIKVDDVTYGYEKGFITSDFFYRKAERKIVVGRSNNNMYYSTENCHDVDDFIIQLNEGTINSIPIIAYYNVNRTFPNNKVEKARPYDDKLIAYENAVGIDSPGFASFENWYIGQENMENAAKVQKKDLTFELPSLKNIRDAFNQFLNIMEPNVFSDLTVKRTSNIKGDFSEDVKAYLTISKNNIPMKFKQFSYGERMIIGLVCEIARRLTIANENSMDALSGEGVVLIDELDLHLHPNWQRSITKALERVFPNIQFIFTSHSPLVLSGLKKENILIINDGEIIPNEQLPDIYSGTADEVLEKLLFAENAIQDFSTEKREIDRLFNLLKFDEAEKQLMELKAKVNASPQWLKDYEQRIEFAKS